ncbi:MAG: Fe-S cluster assembly ATPase SufC [Elusimicrobia bacterium]|nr:Fe-S cluster assembly ATPase SufC [Elusimicrobiota bacterium]
MAPLLEVRDLHAEIKGKPILKGVSLKLEKGEVHALMGPNGSGKSTLSHVIMGHPKYEVKSGQILYQSEDIAGLAPYERARKGIFLGFQYPHALPGVTVANFIRTAMKSVLGSEQGIREFRKTLREKMSLLEMDEKFATRYVNDGFSGGEKKRLEILQMACLAPALAVLDETDSGLDIDALRIVANGINKSSGPQNAILLVTHYQRILRYVKPHFVHVFMEGRIVQSGGPELAEELEKKGYEWLQGKAALS